MHSVTIIGNVGNPPDGVRYTPSGKRVSNFTVASNKKRSSGEELVTWFRVSAWEGLAEIVSEYLSKGRQVYVEGELMTNPQTGGPRLFTRTDGTQGSQFEILANKVIFLGSRPENAENASQGRTNGVLVLQENQIVEEEIPF